MYISVRRKIKERTTPGTGAWTGSLIASVLGMEKKKMFISVFLGVIMAIITMMILSFGILANVIH
ncbi:MAG TPA: small multi-drug export protein [Candidatus Scatovivens faecipullorum]|nr:small multi-drug export protein [Candidatus Scatovivens faecipullorum]